MNDYNNDIPKHKKKSNKQPPKKSDHKHKMHVSGFEIINENWSIGGYAKPVWYSLKCDYCDRELLKRFGGWTLEQIERVKQALANGEKVYWDEIRQ